MLFCDPYYFAILLPITMLVYWFAIVYKRFSLPISILLVASIIFYVTWNWKFCLLLCASATINYCLGEALLAGKPYRRMALLAGIFLNIGLLAYFKYFNFFISNCNAVFGSSRTVTKIVLPLGISFYTFQQIAYIIDAYKRSLVPCSFWQYLLLIIYFPQLAAGPIVYYQDMIPQFGSIRHVDWDSMYRGLATFILGLCKKIIIADSLAGLVQKGYAHIDQLGCLSAWLVSLSYTFQLYFDFSGYADMAIGSGLLFGIRLSENFNSPYKACDIQAFWRRWHMTLSTWLKNFIYIPLGGNRYGSTRTYVNLFLTFLLGGIWHGAGWGFVLWGSLHGLATVIHRLWKLSGIKLNKIIAWFVTFNFVNLAWIFFRAETAAKACLLLRKMFDFHTLKQVNADITLRQLKAILCGVHFDVRFNVIKVLCAITGCLSIVLMLKNTKELCERFWKPHWIKTTFLSLVFWYVYTLIALRSDKIEFLYWQF